MARAAPPKALWHLCFYSRSAVTTARARSGPIAVFGTAPGRRTRQEAAQHRAAPDACAAPGGPAAAPSRTGTQSTCAGPPSMDKSHPSELHALHDSFMSSPQHRLGQSARHPSEPHALHVIFTPSLQHRLGQSASTVQASDVGSKPQERGSWDCGRARPQVSSASGIIHRHRPGCSSTSRASRTMPCCRGAHGT